MDPKTGTTPTGTPTFSSNHELLVSVGEHEVL
jgi:hypothetical protein